MRIYRVEYWCEHLDCADFDAITIKADNIEEAIENFKKEIRLFKRITKITEL
jgi:hypothetical protein